MYILICDINGIPYEYTANPFPVRDHSYITSALKGGRGVGQMLIFADEGGRGGIG